MKIDDAALDRIAELARLDMGGSEERTAMINDMQRVLDFVQALNRVDTKGVEPLIFLNEEENVLREDRAGKPLDKAAALSNAPLKDSDYFKVPRVMNKE